MIGEHPKGRELRRLVRVASHLPLKCKGLFVLLSFSELYRRRQTFLLGDALEVTVAVDVLSMHFSKRDRLFFSISSFFWQSRVKNVWMQGFKLLNMGSDFLKDVKERLG